MDYEIIMHTLDNGMVAEIKSKEIIINNERDAVDLLGNSSYEGARAAIIYEENLPAAFFDLKTRLAGEVLQKFSTYRFRLAIVGEFSKYNSDSLRRFINESNRAGEINFVGTLQEALQKLGS